MYSTKEWHDQPGGKTTVVVFLDHSVGGGRLFPGDEGYDAALALALAAEEIAVAAEAAWRDTCAGIPNTSDPFSQSLLDDWLNS